MRSDLLTGPGSSRLRQTRGRAARMHRGRPANAPIAPLRVESPTRILALQTSVGNQAVSTVIVQRRSAQELIDKRVKLAWPLTHVVDDELVPVGEAPGRFAGFKSEAAALEVARRSPEVTMVFRDPTDGTYHVLRTTARTLGSRYAPPEDPVGWRLVTVVDPRKRSTDEEFRRQYEAARDATGTAQQTAFRRLLETGTHLDDAETAWSPRDGDWSPGKVNVALWLDSRGRHEPADVVPTGTDELPQTTILIGRQAMAAGSDSLRSTLVHESRHAYHLAQTLALVRRWRAVRRSDTLAAWQRWLSAQRRSLPTEVFTTTRAATDPSYGTATTETYSHLYGFMYRFRRDAVATEDPATLDEAATRDLYGRLVGLNVLGTHWEAAGQDVQAETLHLLGVFAASLGANHREHMRRFMAVNGRVASGAPKVFYRELAARL